MSSVTLKKPHHPNAYTDQLLTSLQKTVRQVTSRSNQKEKDSKKRMQCMELLKYLECVFLYGLKGKHAKKGNFWPFSKAVAVTASEYYFYVSDIKFVGSLYFEGGDNNSSARGRAWLRHLLNANRFYITMKLIATQQKLIEVWYEEKESIFNDLEALKWFIRAVAPLYTLSFQLVLQEDVVYTVELKNRTPIVSPKKRRSRGGRISPAPRISIRRPLNDRPISPAQRISSNRSSLASPPPPERLVPVNPDNNSLITKDGDVEAAPDRSCIEPDAPLGLPPPPPPPPSGESKATAVDTSTVEVNSRTPLTTTASSSSSSSSIPKKRPEQLVIPLVSSTSSRRSSPASHQRHVSANGTRNRVASSIGSSVSRETSPHERDVFSIGDGHILAGVMDGFKGEMLFEEDVAKKISQDTDTMHQVINERWHEILKSSSSGRNSDMNESQAANTNHGNNSNVDTKRDDLKHLVDRAKIISGSKDDEMRAHVMKAEEEEQDMQEDTRSRLGSGGEELRSAIGAIDLSKLLVEADVDSPKSGMIS